MEQKLHLLNFRLISFNLCEVLSGKRQTCKFWFIVNCRNVVVDHLLNYISSTYWELQLTTLKPSHNIVRIRHHNISKHINNCRDTSSLIFIFSWTCRNTSGYLWGQCSWLFDPTLITQTSWIYHWIKTRTPRVLKNKVTSSLLFNT